MLTGIWQVHMLFLCSILGTLSLVPYGTMDAAAETPSGTTVVGSITDKKSYDHFIWIKLAIDLDVRGLVVEYHFHAGAASAHLISFLQFLAFQIVELAVIYKPTRKRHLRDLMRIMGG